MRVTALDKLNGVFERDVVCWRQEKMHMLWHENERMQLIAAFPAVSIKSFQEKASVVVDYEQTSALPGGEGYEVSTRPGN